MNPNSKIQVNKNLQNIQQTTRIIPTNFPPAFFSPQPPVNFPPTYRPQPPNKSPWSLPNILIVLVPPIGFFPWKNRPKLKLPDPRETIPQAPALTETPKNSEQQNQVGNKKEEKKDDNAVRKLAKIAGNIDGLFKSITFYICLGVVAAIGVSYIIPQFLGVPV